MKHSLRPIPAVASILSSNSPEPPMKGLPVISSWAPGASPTITILLERSPDWISFTPAPVLLIHQLVVPPPLFLELLHYRYVPHQLQEVWQHPRLRFVVG